MSYTPSYLGDRSYHTSSATVHPLPPALPAEYETDKDSPFSAINSSARVYTLLLATVAGAGVAIATVLVCCVIRTYLLQRRSRGNNQRAGATSQSRRQQTPAPSALRSDSGTGQNRESAQCAEISKHVLPPDVPWIAEILAEEEEQEESQTRKKQTVQSQVASSPKSSAPSLPDRGKEKVEPPSLQRSNRLDQAGRRTNLGHASQHLPSTSTQQRRTGPEGDGTMQSPNSSAHPQYDATIQHLAEAMGGVEALRAATCSSFTIPATHSDYIIIRRTQTDPEAALSCDRLRMCSVAACILRMQALTQTGRNPCLAVLAPPWTLERVELKLELSMRKEASEAMVTRESISRSDVESQRSMNVSEVQSQCSSLSDDQSDILERQDSARTMGRTVVTDLSQTRGSQPAEQQRGGDLELVEIEIQEQRDTTSSQQGLEAADSESSASTPSRQKKKYILPIRNPWKRLKELRCKDLTGALQSRICATPAALTVQAKSGARLAEFSLDDLSTASGETPRPRNGSTTILGICSTHIGTVQPGMVCGQQVEVLKFKRDTKKQLLRLCTLLEASPHPCIAGPVALCTVPGKEAAVVSVGNTCTLEAALQETDEDSMPQQQGTSSSDIQEEAPLPWSARLAIAYDLMLGLHHLHHSFSSPLVHGSINTSSVNLSAGLHASLTSPGFLPASMTIAEQGIESVGPEGLRPASLIPGIMPVVKDFAYLDPQYAKRGQFTPPADVFALGVVLLKLITALPAKGIVTVAKEAHRQGMLEDVLDPSAGDWPPSVAKGLMELALSCCERRHTRRCKLENADIFKLQGLLLDSLRLFLCDHGIMSVAQSLCPISAELPQQNSPAPLNRHQYGSRSLPGRNFQQGDSSQHHIRSPYERQRHSYSPDAGSTASGSGQTGSSYIQQGRREVTSSTPIDLPPGVSQPARLDQ